MPETRKVTFTLQGGKLEAGRGKRRKKGKKRVKNREREGIKVGKWGMVGRKTKTLGEKKRRIRICWEVKR